MIELGKRQLLSIVKKVDFGVYLADTADQEANEDDRILLPMKEVPADSEIGDPLEVFVYRDSKDRKIATTRQALLELHQTALLKVKEIGKIGAFLDWGLEKDLLLPFREQVKPVQAGEECLAALYIDKSNRLCATTKVYHYLKTDSPYQKDDRVEGLIYEISDNFGAFVAVDNLYSALLPKTEPLNGASVGDHIQARVTEVKPDGKLKLSMREKSYIQVNEDAQKLLTLLQQAGGFLPLHDKSSPDVIREKTGMSKNEFKRAIGNLYKQHLIVIDDKGIQIV